MSLGRQIRLSRLFAHSSGRLCGVAVDHFFSYGLERLRSGASGAVIGRNVWGASGITRTLRAMRAAIHGE